jgi:nicotinamidase-related amidase
VNERRLTARTTNNVVHLRPFVDPLAVPTVVLVDLQQEYVAAPRRMAVPDASAALTIHCEKRVAALKKGVWVTRFMKATGKPMARACASRRLHCVEGFSPLPTEMVFERELPSCYSNEDFANVMNEGAGVNIVLAGFAGESACLSTVIDAYHRGHRLTFLSDASASHAVETVTASNVHSLLSKVLGLYATVAMTAAWIDATSQWPICGDLGRGPQSHEAG